jgi:hypothetical protein
MTSDKFSEIQVGSSINEVRHLYGEPYAVHSNKDGTKVFEYMEKVMMGKQVIAQRKYFFVVSNEKIISKYMKVANAPAYNEIYLDDAYFPNY